MRNAAVSTPCKKRIIYRVTVLTAVFGLSILGCGRETTPTAAKPTVEIAPTKIDRQGLADAVAQNRGKVVLVEFWATWCAPCVKLFPHTVELHERLADHGFVVIAVSMDDTDNQEAALRFLRNRQAKSENYISQYGLGSEGFTAFDITDGALPHLKLYDRDGRLQETFASGGQPLEPEQIDRAVEELLKQ